MKGMETTRENYYYPEHHHHNPYSHHYAAAAAVTTWQQSANIDTSAGGYGAESMGSHQGATFSHHHQAANHYTDMINHPAQTQLENYPAHYQFIQSFNQTHANHHHHHHQQATAQHQHYATPHHCAINDDDQQATIYHNHTSSAAAVPFQQVNDQGRIELDNNSHHHHLQHQRTSSLATTATTTAVVAAAAAAAAIVNNKCSSRNYKINNEGEQIILTELSTTKLLADNLTDDNENEEFARAVVRQEFGRSQQDGKRSKLTPTAPDEDSCEPLVKQDNQRKRAQVNSSNGGKRHKIGHQSAEQRGGYTHHESDSFGEPAAVDQLRPSYHRSLDYRHLERPQAQLAATGEQVDAYYPWPGAGEAVAGLSPSGGRLSDRLNQQQQPRAAPGGYLQTRPNFQVNEDEGRHSASSVSSSLKQQQQQQATPSNSNGTPTANSSNSNEHNQLRVLEMRKEKSRDAARSRRSKENHEFYELAKLLPLPAAITSQLDFLDKASIIRLTISFLKLRQFSVNGHPPWAPDFTTLGSVNPYSSQSLNNYAEQYTNQDESQSRPTSVGGGFKQQPGTNNHFPVITGGGIQNSTLTQSSQNLSTNHPSAQNSSDSRQNVAGTPTNTLPPSSVAFSTVDQYHHLHHQHHQVTNYSHLHGDNLLMNDKINHMKNSNTSSLFDLHQGTHILQSLDGFAFAIGRDGRFLYISETVSMYLGLSQVEMTGASVFDYTHQQDHEELAQQLGIPYTSGDSNQNQIAFGGNCESPPPASNHSQYSAASNETQIEDYVNSSCPRKKSKATLSTARGAYGRNGTSNKRAATVKQSVKGETSMSNVIKSESPKPTGHSTETDQSRPPVDRANGTQEDSLVRQFCIRMKSTLTKRGCQHFKSSGYRVVHVVAHLRSYQSNDHGHLMDPLDEAATVQGAVIKNPKHRRGSKQVNKDLAAASAALTAALNAKDSSKGSNDNTTSDINTQGGEKANSMCTTAKPKIIGMVAVAIALAPPSINELRLESDTFVLRLGLDLRVTHIEPKITELLHYPIELVAGRSLYSLVHPNDVEQVQKCHRDLLKKGQMMSGYYRLLARSGGYIWIQTCATLICNNTLGSGQNNALPSSPMPPAGNSSAPPLSMTHMSDQYHNHHHHLHQQQLQHSKPLSFLTPPTIQPGDQMTLNQYGNQLPHHSKIASPGLSSSHLSSNFDNQDQDQCVIFVNYMITNVVDNDEILDICQSSNYTPLSSSFSGSNNSHNNSTNNINNSSKNNNNNNTLFNSPSSSCSSPCLGSIKTNTGCSGGGGYISPATPTGSVNLTSPSRRHHGSSEAKTRNTAELKLPNGRRAGAKLKGSPSSASGDNSHPGGLNSASAVHSGERFEAHLEQAVKVDPSGTYESPAAGDNSTQSSIYGYSQTPGSVNLALNKVHSDEASSWLDHSSSGGGSGSLYGSTGGSQQQVASVAATNHATDHYSNMNRSIYKAAFGLDVNNPSYSHHHHHHPHQQQAAMYSAAPVAGYGASVAGNTWDTTSAAVAAVAAASNHLTGHHHHHSTGNPYAHLESHHHNQSAHNLSSAAAAAANHHQAAGSYYNYYGYYGNKFI